MYFALTDVVVYYRRSASKETTSLKVQINYFWFDFIAVTINWLVPVGITKRPGCMGQMRA